MENRSHNIEPFEKRIKRFQDGHPIEIIETLLNSIANFFNNEIRLTTEDDRYQTSLMFLGIHAVALTISEGFFNKNGDEGYKLFLEKFIDGKTADTKFSEVAEYIHGWRNILAHQWLGAGGYNIGYDYVSKLGWEKRNETIFINPQIYCNCYLNAFTRGGRIWDYQKMFTEEELNKIKKRLLIKFLSH
jgi:hypothetical protein